LDCVSGNGYGVAELYLGFRLDSLSRVTKCDSEGGATTGTQILNYQGTSELTPTAQMDWYAIQTRSRHEKMVVQQLHQQGITTFLPLSTELREWSDRQKLVEFPLFPGYAFVRMAYGPEERLRVLRTEGVVNFVGTAGRGIAIPEKQIEHVQTLLANKVPFESYPFLKVGQRVRIRGGALNGTEGILVRKDADRMLVISVELIQRSLSIRLQGYEVEPV
jgi:transcription antitermination factor NusG